MKLLRIGAAKQMVMIGEDPKSATWYAIGDNVKKYMEKYAIGDDITIKSEKINGKDVLTFIQKGNGAIRPTTTATTSDRATAPSVDKPAPRAPYSYGKSPEETNIIKAQAIGHMTSRVVAGALVALQGQVSEANLQGIVNNIIDATYPKFKEVVG